MSRRRPLSRTRLLTRRQFLKRGGALAGAALLVPALPGCGSSGAPAAGSATGREPGTGAVGQVFRHGIASGDPLSDRIVFWTRVTPPIAQAVDVRLQVAADSAFTQPLATATTRTDASRDYTVKIDLAGLAAGSTCYYRFEALGARSSVGRARTLPAAGVLPHLRFGAITCQSYENGFFNAHRRLAARADLDFVLHLGDYIYEYGDGEYGTQRQLQPPHEILTLEDYRNRHAWYRLDPDLVELHRQHSTLHLWDDHDSANNSWPGGAQNHTEGGEGAWADRLAASVRAFFEWLPIREPAVGRQIHRRFSCGDLVDFVLLDTRLDGRTRQASSPAGFRDAALRIIGDTQRAWLADSLAASRARWRCVVSGVMFGQYKAQGLPEALGGGVYPYDDQWDGYQHERGLVLDLIAPYNNLTVVSGDLHGSVALDVARDPNNPTAYSASSGMGSLCGEFVVNSATSPGDLDTVGPDGTANASEAGVRAQNPQMKYFDQDQRGYNVFDVTPARFQGEWWFVDGIAVRSNGERLGTAWQQAAGSRHLTAATQSAGIAASPAPAP